MFRKRYRVKTIGLLQHTRQATKIACLLAATTALFSGSVFANHTVLVEGEQDYDGDGLLGADEDLDGDQVYGTVMGGVNGIGDNGRVMIVTSGRFLEQVNLAGSGVTVLEGAPGVNAVIEAFQGGGDAEQNNTRQQQPGIIVDSDGTFPLEIRNIVSRNWTEGIRINGSARVTIDNVRLDSNVNYGIRVRGGSSVVITDSQINSSGFRRSGSLGLTPGGDIAPSPGVGIAFEDTSSGFISLSTVAHSFSTGIMSNGGVRLLGNTVFDNKPNYDGFW